MRRGLIGTAVAGVLLLSGCAAEAEVTEPTAERSGPATLAPNELGEDVVDVPRVQNQIDDLRAGLDDAEQEVRSGAESALDTAQQALDEAEPLRQSDDEDARGAAVESLESAVAALEDPSLDSPDGFGRAVDELAAELRRLAEELRQAPAGD